MRGFGEVLLYCMRLPTLPLPQTLVCVQPHSLTNGAQQRAAFTVSLLFQGGVDRDGPSKRACQCQGMSQGFVRAFWPGCNEGVGGCGVAAGALAQLSVICCKGLRPGHGAGCLMCLAPAECSLGNVLLLLRQ